MRDNLLLERSYVPKTKSWLLPKENFLPTMYDLPSEEPEDSGLPDDFHYHQPQLLRETFCPPNSSPEQIYVASDLNLYYDVEHHDWYKRPDWFAVLGVPPLYGAERELRYSYVIWQEKVSPFIVIELLSEGTEKEDLGQTSRKSVKKPPTKWEVYEQQLQIPYYVVFSRNPDKFQAFQLINGRYHELTLDKGRFWLPQIQLGLGLWQGNYNGAERQWLRWYDAKNRWISTPLEHLSEESQARLAEKQRADSEAKARLAEKQRADSEAKARLAEKQRADSAETELARLKALLTKEGLSL
jgi:Uma2 family endonuclease